MDTSTIPTIETPAKSALNHKQEKLSKKESLKEQKRSYKQEKKKVSLELKSTIKDPSVIILSDWLKGRTTLKNWTRIWCVLKPGVLVIYKSAKGKQWVGTVLLTSCEVIERPTKKEGFCFKLYHPLNQSIWALKGPKGESMGVLKNTFPSGCLILRASSDSDGHCWMDAVELAHKCSRLLKKSITAAKSNQSSFRSKKNKIKHLDDSKSTEDDVSIPSIELQPNAEIFSPEVALDLSLLQQQLSHLKRDRSSDECGNLDSLSESSVVIETHRRTESKTSSSDVPVITEAEQYIDTNSSDSEDNERESDYGDEVEPQAETKYVAEDKEDFGEAGEAAQTEVLAGENKSLVWTLLKQLRPGMDLSKVVLPTFILEPRSFLDKLADYYYHVDLISKATMEDNPYERMKGIAKWYLSGFYKKPKGLKKPYNPILGETFRCKWIHPDTGSTTYYIAEQVSHHPPVSNFAVVNRKDGFVINSSILAKSKFYGNSLSAILDGEAKLLLLERGEEYTVTMPYAHCKGILYGTMTMEFGGKVSIICDKTGYSTELEFKLKPFFGGNDAVNRISGKIQLGRKVLATINGFWDQKVNITDSTGKEELFWEANTEVRKSRLTRYLVDLEEQGEFESQNLWRHVTAAINKCNQVDATEQKHILEEAQRQAARERHHTGEKWVPKYFEFDEETHSWSYKYTDVRPWDKMNDIEQFEYEGRIDTKRRLKTSRIKNQSLPRSMSNLHVKSTGSSHWRDRSSSVEEADSETDATGTLKYQTDPSFSQEILGQSLKPICEQQVKILDKISYIEETLKDLQSSQNNPIKFEFMTVLSILMILLAIIFSCFYSFR